MPILVLDELLAPIPGDQPCGRNLRFEADWDKLQSLRGSDREAWEGGGVRDGKWRELRDFAVELTRSRSKDLRIAAYIAEACGRLHGFSGVTESLQLVRELLVRYWSLGLHPFQPNGNVEARVAALSWFNEKFSDLLSSIPFIPSLNGQTGYTLGHYHQAREVVGWERNTRDSNGDTITEKKAAFTRALEAGLISLDMYSAALDKMNRQSVEQLNEIFSKTLSEFRLFSQVIDEAFKSPNPAVKNTLTPSLSTSRQVLVEIGSQIDAILEKKRAAEPDRPSAEKEVASPGPSTPIHVFPISESDSKGAWAEAEGMIRAGQVDAGLALMSRLAANETSGRSRFYRKLLLAEICITRGRDRLARTILEELNDQIEKHHLGEWETPQWTGKVWSRLYRIYRKSEPDSDRTKDLYKRLSSADPWQALEIPDE